MLRLSSLSLFLLFFSHLLFASTFIESKCPLVYEQLCSLNKYWEYHQMEDSILNERICFDSHVDLIQLHLKLVEKSLIAKEVEHLSKDQKANRVRGLKILNDYWRKKNFPINSHHPGEVVPYFIDDFNTACAVGHIIRETGFSDFAERVKRENNYAYIEDMDYPELEVWAKNNGFDELDLRWIQPGYGCWADRTPIWVTNTANAGVGSLSWAITQANNDVQPNEIKFDLPANAVIYPTDQLWLSGSCDAINGYMNNGTRVIIDGTNFNLSNWGIVINADDFNVTALIIRNYPFTAIGAWERNNISFQDNILYANQNGIEVAGGCQFISISYNTVGVDENMNNNQPPNSEEYGIWIDDANFVSITNNTIAGIGGDGHIGIILDSDDPGSDISIANNKIGVDNLGSTAIPNHYGISVGTNKSAVTIFNNIISGNEDAGILVYGEDVDIYDNLIGWDESLQIELPQDSSGIWISNASNVQIYRNKILGNSVSTWGIYCSNSVNVTIGDETEINKNEINNSYVGIGIDNPNQFEIDINELTCNDFPIWFVNQNFITPPPSISSVSVTSSNSEILGTSLPNTSIDIYIHNPIGCANALCQGKGYVGTTQSNSNGDWDFTSNNLLDVGAEITALATLNNNTSSYADCIVASNNSLCFDPSIITGNPCTQQFEPVCGCDGNTYSNACFATESGITSYTLGECVNNSNCSAPQDVIDFYTRDAKVLAQYYMASDPFYQNQIEIPTLLIDRYTEKLFAVYNAYDIPERDTVVECLNIHSRGPFRGYIVEGDLSTEWMTQLNDGIFPTSNSEVNNLVTTYNLNYSDFIIDGQYQFKFSTNEIYNFAALFNAINALSGVTNLYYEQIFWTCGFDEIYVVEELNSYIDLAFHYDRCWDGIDWTFRVFNDCTVELLNRINTAAGFDFEPVCSNNYQCATDPLCLPWVADTLSAYYDFYEQDISPDFNPEELIFSSMTDPNTGNAYFELAYVGGNFFHYFDCDGNLIDNCFGDYSNPNGGWFCENGFDPTELELTQTLWNGAENFPDCSGLYTLTATPNPAEPNEDINVSYVLSQLGSTNRITFGDGNSVDIDDLNGTTIHTYENAGNYHIRLFVDGEVKASQWVQIESCGWYGYVTSNNGYREGNEDICDVVTGDGRMYLNPDLTPLGYYWTNYSNTREFDACGDYATLEVRMKVPSSEGGISCYDPSIRFFGEEGGARVAFMTTGCSFYSSISAGDVSLSGSSSNLDALVGDFSDWVVLKLELSDQSAKAYYNDELRYTLPYTENIGAITGLSVRAKGSGSVDWVRLYEGDGTLIYEENFDNCNEVNTDESCLDLMVENCNPVNYIPCPSSPDSILCMGWLNTQIQNLQDLNCDLDFVNVSTFDWQGQTLIGVLISGFGGTNETYYDCEGTVVATCIEDINGSNCDPIVDEFIVLENLWSCNQPLPNCDNCDPLPNGYFANNLCDGEVFTYYNIDYTNSGTYEILLEGASYLGCDSIVVFDLFFNSSNPEDVTAEYCESEGFYTYPENNQDYTAGFYEILLPGASSEGCDSTVLLTVIENICTPPPPWDVSCNNQGVKHFVHIWPNEFTSSIGPNELPLEDGDWIGVFYAKDDGTYACTDTAQFFSNQNLTLIACAESTVGADDGFENGELFKFKIFKDGQEFGVSGFTIQYHPIGSLIDPVFPDATSTFAGNTRQSALMSIETITIIDPDCDDPRIIDCGTVYLEENNVDGISEAIVYNCSANLVDGPEVIYEFENSTVQDIKICVDNLSNDLELYLLDLCDKDHCIGKSTKADVSPEVLVYEDLPIGYYYVVVEGYFGYESTYDISLECGDYEQGGFNCEATEINCGDNFIDNTFDACAEVNWYSCAEGFLPGNEKVYKFKFNTSGWATIMMEPLDVDLDLILLDQLDPNLCLASSRESLLETEQIEYPVIANKYYYIIVDEYKTENGGTFELSVSCSVGGPPQPSCLSCDNVEEIFCNTPIQGDTNNGIDCVEKWGDCSVFNNGKELIYEFNNTVLQDVIFKLNGFSENLNLYILNACSRYECNPDWQGIKSGLIPEGIVVQALEPGTYYIVVDSYEDGGESDFTLEIECDGDTQLDCFTIPVPAGISYISSNVTPNNPDLFFILDEDKYFGVIDNITSDKQITFAPGWTQAPGNFEFNTWSVVDGYSVYAYQDTSIQICGEQVDPSAVKIVNYLEDSTNPAFKSNFIYYPFGESKNVEEAFEEANQDNLFAIWDYGINNQTTDVYFWPPSLPPFEMHPGKGYVLWALQDGAFSYRSENYVANGCQFFRTPFNHLKNTSWVKISGSLLTEKLNPEDEIGFFNNEGQLIGSCKNEGVNVIFPIPGDVSSTPIVDGYFENENLTAKVWNSVSGKVKDLQLEFSNHSTQFEKGVSYLLSDFEIEDAPDTATLDRLIVYPVPTNNLLTLEYLKEYRGDLNISLRSIEGKTILQQSYRDVFGNFRTVLNLNNLSSGIYILSVQTGEKIFNKKIVVAK